MEESEEKIEDSVDSRKRKKNVKIKSNKINNANKKKDFRLSYI